MTKLTAIHGMAYVKSNKKQRSMGSLMRFGQSDHTILRILITVGVNGKNLA